MLTCSTSYHTFSINVGASRVLTSVKCCDSDYCNYETLPVPAPRPPNTLKCHYCIPGTYLCSITVQCRGDEDRCFYATVTSPSGTSPLLGCTSSNMCDAAATMQNLMYKEGSHYISNGPTCCYGALCNAHSAKTTPIPPTVPQTPKGISQLQPTEK
uniref:UPAR/Ly6 domain-containing protein n=1 Tax=Gouania willdenowi TaxID=441366 RepID=A0A8C5DIG9_GOUWI